MYDRHFKNKSSVNNIKMNERINERNEMKTFVFMNVLIQKIYQQFTRNMFYYVIIIISKLTTIIKFITYWFINEVSFTVNVTSL